MQVTSLFDNQVERLMKQVRQLAASKGTDPNAYAAVRKQVSGELMNQGKLEIVSATIGELAGEEGADVLTAMVSHCSETFYLEDRVLSAVAVPVGIRLKSRVDGGVVLSHGRPDDLASLAKVMQTKLGSRKVVFDTRLYDGRALYYANAKKLMEFLLKLEAGETRPDGGPKSCQVLSKSDSEWEMVYFLGVEVVNLEDKPLLNEENSQRELMRWRCHAEWALAESESVFFNTEIATDAKCHGIWYLGKGVAIGEDLIRGYRLQSFLANFDQGVTGVKFNYTHDVTNFLVKLLVTSHLMTVEFKWKLIGDESLDGFRAALDMAIDAVIPADDVRQKRQLDLYDYDQLARSEGLVWN